MRKSQARNKLQRIIDQVAALGETPAKIDALYIFGPYAEGAGAPDYLGVAGIIDMSDPYTEQLAFDRTYRDTLHRRLRGALKLTNNERIELVFANTPDQIKPQLTLVWSRTIEPWHPPTPCHESWAEAYPGLQWAGA